ncbi:hypothetical protein FB451DRAFT_1411440 [Mycena latifolia]|nr:hypothetical protein FB451DRAFT_1411440 [Mycena latifolia]
MSDTMVVSDEWHSMILHLYTTSMSLIFYVSTIIAVRIVQKSQDAPIRLHQLSSALTLARNALFSCNTLLGHLLFVESLVLTRFPSNDISPDLSVLRDLGWPPIYNRRSLHPRPCGHITGAVDYTTWKNHLTSFAATYELNPRIPYILGVLANLSLVMLTAGRIWWIRRGAHIVSGNIFERQYGLALTLMPASTSAFVNCSKQDNRLDSGATYCVFGIVLAIFASPNAPAVGGAILYGIAGQGVVSQDFLRISYLTASLQNILPTLTIVRVGLGHNIQDTIQEIATAQVPSREHSSDSRLGGGRLIHPS